MLRALVILPFAVLLFWLTQRLILDVDNLIRAARGKPSQRYQRCLEDIIDMEIEAYGQPMSISTLQALGRDIEVNSLLEGRWRPNPRFATTEEKARRKALDRRIGFKGGYMATRPAPTKPPPPSGRGSASSHRQPVFGVERVTPERAALNEHHRAIGYGSDWGPMDAGRVLEHLESAHGFQLTETTTGSELALRHATFHWPGTDGTGMHGIAHCNKCDDSFAVRGSTEEAMVYDAQYKLRGHHRQEHKRTVNAGPR